MKDNPKGGFWHRGHGQSNSLSVPCMVFVSIVNFAALAVTVYYWTYRPPPAPIFKTLVIPPIQSTYLPITDVKPTIAQPSPSVSVEDFDKLCTDPEWCNVPMPAKSHYYFDPPTDLNLWKKSQIIAMRGDQVLLKDAIKAFPNHMDFLDGDISFRKMHYAMDIFLDEKRDLSPLLPVMAGSRVSKMTDDRTRRLAAASSYPWEAEGKRVIPDTYDFRLADRAPVISVGYTAYQRDSQTYFSGNRLGGAFLDRNRFFGYWRKVKNRIDFPFISVCTLNENWGFLSTYFPNRTAAWGKCCDNPRDAIVYEFLNHEKTLLLVTNQHVNISHPKLLIWPRGIPITWGTTSKLVWDTMRNVYQASLADPAKHNKNLLLLAASSSWGPRPQILQCVSNHFSVDQFDGHVMGAKGYRLDRREYYIKMTKARFVLGLPGLGYDCFRHWEVMTMGSIIVLEKGVGLERTMYRLPALFVDDFYDVNPALLHSAYVEAVYRSLRGEWEHHRLTQSYWFNVLLNVSVHKSPLPYIESHPLIEDGLTRPRERYDCGVDGKKCGEGTRRIPKQSC